jgi:hypothetical protein
MGVSLIGMASHCGVTSNTLIELVRGKVGIGVGARLNCLSSSLQEFVDGGTSIGLASRLGIMSSSLQELRNAIGKEGAIGLLIGLMHQQS